MDLHKIALVVFVDNKILGVFDNEVSLNYFIDGGIQNNYFKKENITVEAYGMNSCFCFNKVDDKQPKVDNSKLCKVENKLSKEELLKKTEDNVRENLLKKLEETRLQKELDKKKKELEESKEYQDMRQEQINVVHEINELKGKMKKIAEEKVSFNYDLDLFKQLNKEKANNPNFVIPELFSLKYTLISKLEEENKLDFDNFKLQWDVIKPKNNYNLFTPTSHEELFSKKEKDSISTEINLEL